MHREILRAVLSLVYFPLWVVPSGTAAAPRVTVVDAVAGSIVARDADAAPLEALAQRGPGGRPRARLPAALLSELRLGSAGAPAGRGVPLHLVRAYLGARRRGPRADRERGRARVRTPRAPAAPCRTCRCGRCRAALRVSGSQVTRPLPERLFAPAFRWRALKALCDLGARLARTAPAAPGLEPAKDMPLVGCSLDRADAVTMARLVALRLLFEDAHVRQRTCTGADAPSVEIDETQSRLVWLPFAGDAYSVREPFTGYALPRRAVEELVLTPDP